MAKPINYTDILETGDSGIYDIQTHAAGPEGSLPLTAEMLLNRPSGDVFGLTHNAAMGLGTDGAATRRIPDPQHTGRYPRP